MSTVRIQVRRGTASQWTSVNPILAAGEMGLESDTNFIKFGNGTDHWDTLAYANDPTSFDLNNTLADYVLVSDVGNAGGPAKLDADGNLLVPKSSIILEGSSADAYETTLTVTNPTADRTITFPNATGTVALTSDVNTAISNLVDGAPTALNTLNELAAALGDDENYAASITTALGNLTSAGVSHASASTNVHGIADTNLLATKTFANEAAGDAVGTHNLASTNVHGIANTANLVLKTGATMTGVLVLNGAPSNDLEASTKKYVDDKVSTHASVTQNVHGITNTADLATQSYVTNITDNLAPKANPTFTGTVAGITKSMVGLANVDNTTDANKPVSTATQTALDAKLALSGGTMTGALTLSGAPTSDLHAATKQYVDGLAAGINFHAPVVAATAGNLAGNYNNGTNGYLATLTKASNGSIGTIDGATVAVGNRILLRAQTDAKQNGIYVITALGDGSNPWVITRAADNDNNPAGELSNGDFCFVTSGSTNGSKGFIVSTTGTITIGTTEINYAQFNASEAIIAGTNINKNGATISVVSTPVLDGVQFSDGTQTKQGVPSITSINLIDDLVYSSPLTLDDISLRDKMIEVAAASAFTINIPTNSAVAYPVGTSFDIMQTGSGEVTIAGDTGVTVNATPGLKLRTQWSSCTLFKRATDSWVVYGDLKA
jgi:hypothetical protein